jgi:hypothetical protein
LWVEEIINQKNEDFNNKNRNGQIAHGQGTKGVPCVIVDEIHVFGRNEDILLIVLKDILP